MEGVVAGGVLDLRARRRRVLVSPRFVPGVDVHHRDLLRGVREQIDGRLDPRSQWLLHAGLDVMGDDEVE